MRFAPPDEQAYHWGEMPAVTPQFSRTQVNKAGKVLISTFPTLNSLALLDPDEYENEILILRDKYLSALGIINNWRASHTYPLRQFRLTVAKRARRLGVQALIVQRLKRLRSIEAKLENKPTMMLARMQDIGGCRAIVDSINLVDRLVEDLRRDLPHATYDDSRDYILSPKPDGYRSVHLMYIHNTSSEVGRAYNGLHIELQIRSKMQHAWATAVETVSTFTGQALKTDGGQGDWGRFFCLMGSVMAAQEERRIVPGTAQDNSTLQELEYLADKLNVEAQLAGWRRATLSTESKRGKKLFLLQLDLDGRVLHVRGFTPAQSTQASEAYAHAENEHKNHPRWQTVLVAADSISALRRAYPNYFLDTDVFLRTMRSALGPSWPWQHM